MEVAAALAGAGAGAGALSRAPSSVLGDLMQLRSDAAEEKPSLNLNVLQVGLGEATAVRPIGEDSRTEDSESGKGAQEESQEVHEEEAATEPSWVCVAANAVLLDAYVEQTGPACAAAVVAGAVNALRGSADWTQHRVVGLYVRLVGERLAAKRQRIERLVGDGCCLAGLLDADDICTVADARRHVRAYCGTDERLRALAALWDAQDQDAAATGDSASAREAQEGQELEQDAEQGDEEDDQEQGGQQRKYDGEGAWGGQNQKGQRAIEDPDADAEKEADSESRKAATLIVIPVHANEKAARSKMKKRGAGNGMLAKELKELLRLHKGAKALAREKPSTGCIGNWALKRAVAIISAEHCSGSGSGSGAGLACESLLGRAKGCRMRVSAGDSAATIDDQFLLLQRLFCMQHRGASASASASASAVGGAHILVLHLKNHYAPVFALRVALDGSRELLTARKGQRPKHWVRFSTLRALMLRWAGYCVLAVRLVPLVPLEPLVPLA